MFADMTFLEYCGFARFNESAVWLIWSCANGENLTKERARIEFGMPRTP